MVESLWIQRIESEYPGEGHGNQYVWQKLGDSYDQERWVNTNLAQCPDFQTRNYLWIDLLKNRVQLLNSN